MKIAYSGAKIHVGNGESFVGTLITENERISALYTGAVSDEDLKSADRVVSLDGMLLLPGMIDAHTHGRVGYDFTSATEEQMKIMARSYLGSGVTTLMPTLASAPFSQLCEASDRIRSVAERDDEILPWFCGVHLEGRYLNPAKRGAHAPEQLAEPNVDELKALLPHLGKCFHISFAPECDKDGAFLETAVLAGGTVGIAHTNATYEEAITALQRGATSFTHTFNAMPPLHHREGGAVAAAFTSDAYAELIVDGIHVSKEMVRLAYHCKGKEKLVLITDSMEATGCADGRYSIAGQTCIVTNGIAMTEDGHLAGSTLSLFDGLQNLMRFAETSLDEALPTVTINPAKMLGVEKMVGSLEVSKYADLLVVDPSSDKMQIRSVIMRGREVDLTTGK